MMRRALVIGGTGQTGSYLTEFLVEKGYDVTVGTRRVSQSNSQRLEHVLSMIRFAPVDLLDESSLRQALLDVRPDEVYNFAAQSHVGLSFKEPLATANVTGLGALRLFEAVRTVWPRAKVYQAASCEQFGVAQQSPQTERTPMHPISPYACAKLFAYRMAQTYRQAYQLFISCGIAFNHESPRRGEDFVTRKITKTLAQIKHGLTDVCWLGDLSPKRDFSHAKDIAWGAWQLLQHPVADDMIFASGQSTSIESFAHQCCTSMGLDYAKVIRIDPALVRPTDIPEFIGSSEKATSLLGWYPTVTLPELIKEMCDADLAEISDHHSPRPQRWSSTNSTPTIHLSSDLSQGSD